MQLEHRFTVPAPIEVAWETLNDLESVGSCFPGATVTSVDGDEFAGTCRIKLGPISMQYAGSGRFVERDEDARRAVIEAKGKDRRGNGTAAVTVTASMTAESDASTAVAVATDLNITGKPAQFGRGVIQDVSDKLLGQFTQCLESRIGSADDEGVGPESAPAAFPESGSAAAQPAPDREPAAQPGTETPPVDVPAAGDAAPAAAAASAGTASGAAAGPRSETAPGGGTAALDLGATVLPVLAKRYAPHALGALAVLLVLWRLLRR